jgi:preprotein translocase SecE subunit
MLSKTLHFLGDIKRELYSVFYPSVSEIKYWFINILITVIVFSIIFFFMDSFLSTTVKELISFKG